MKLHLPFLILVSMAFAGCALFSPYTTVNDEFRNTKTSTLDITVNPSEYQSAATNAKITFERVTSKTNETLNAYFVIARTSSSFNLGKKCFVKADGKSYEISIESEGSEYRTGQESTSTSTIVKDSTKVKSELVSKTNSYNWIDEKFVLRLTPEIKSSLLKTNELIFRFYFGPKEGTFRLTGYTLKRLKGLFEI